MKKKQSYKVFEACCDKLDSVRLEKYTPNYGNHPQDSYQVVVDVMGRDDEAFATEFDAARKVAKKHGCKMTVDAESEGVILTLWRGR